MYKSYPSKVRAVLDSMKFLATRYLKKKPYILVSEGNYSIMVTGGNDSLVKVWKLWNKGKKSAQMEKMKTLSGHGESIMSVRFAQNGRIFVSTSGDKTLRIWHASNLVCLRVIEGHGRYGWDFVEIFSLNSLRFWTF